MNRIHWNSTLVEGTITYDFTLHLGPVTTLHDFGKCLRTAFGHFLLGSHNFMGTALGTCMRWPLASSDKHKQVWNHRIRKCFRTCLSWSLRFSNSRIDSQWNLSHKNGQQIGTEHNRMCGADGSGTQFRLFCTNLSKISPQLASLVMCMLPVRHHKVLLIGYSRERAMLDDESQRHE